MDRGNRLRPKVAGPMEVARFALSGRDEQSGIMYVEGPDPPEIGRTSLSSDFQPPSDNLEVISLIPHSCGVATALIQGLSK